MKIGLFTDQYYPQVSGVVTSIKMLYEGLEALGHECIIFTLGDRKKLENDPEIAGKKIVCFKGMHYPFKAARIYRFTFNFRRCVKIVKKYDLDMIHVHTEFSISHIAERAAKKLNIPLVHTMHTAWIEYICTLFPKTDKFMHEYWVKVMKKLFTGPVAKASVIEILPTKKMLALLDDYGVPKNKETRIVPTGIELDRFTRPYPKEDLEALKKDCNIENKFVFAYIGRLASEKNIEFIIEGFAQTFKNYDDVVLLIVGGGDKLANLQNEVSKFGIEDKVVFTGMVDYDIVPLYYQISDVFLNASRSETQGLTYIEALAAGLPNIVFKDDCVIDLIKEGYNGYFFESLTELELKCKKIYENRNNLDEMKKNARLSSEPYSKQQFAQNILDVYNEAIAIKNGKK